MKTISKSPVLFRGLYFLTLLAICLSTFYSCSESDKSMQESMRGEMVSLMNTLRDSAIELDPEKTINLCFDSPEFLYCSDGLVMNYQQFVKAGRENYPKMANHQLIIRVIIAVNESGKSERANVRDFSECLTITAKENHICGVCDIVFSL